MSYWTRQTEPAGLCSNNEIWKEVWRGTNQTKYEEIKGSTRWRERSKNAREKDQGTSRASEKGDHRALMRGHGENGHQEQYGLDRGPEQSGPRRSTDELLWAARSVCGSQSGIHKSRLVGKGIYRIPVRGRVKL